jgi:hypothetical protein
MDLSQMTWCPPPYVSLSLVAMMAYPLIFVGFCFEARSWRSPAPLLLTSLHLLAIAYLGVRDALMGMARSGPLPVRLGVFASAVGDTYRLAWIGCFWSVVMLTLAALGLYRSRTITIPNGRRKPVLSILMSVVALHAPLTLIWIQIINASGIKDLVAAYRLATLCFYLVVAMFVLVVAIASAAMIRPTRFTELAPLRSGLMPIALAAQISIGLLSWSIERWMLHVARAG